MGVSAAVAGGCVSGSGSVVQILYVHEETTSVWLTEEVCPYPGLLVKCLIRAVSGVET